MDTVLMERLVSILKTSNREDWEGIFFPNVHMRLKLALSTLNRNTPNFWELSAEGLYQKLEEFPYIKAQFEAHNDTTLAFAIRTLRMAKA